MKIVVMSKYGQQQAECEDSHKAAAVTLAGMVSSMKSDTVIDVFVFAKGNENAVYGIRASAASEYLRQLSS